MQTGHSSSSWTSLVDAIPRFPLKLEIPFLKGELLNSAFEVATSSESPYVMCESITSLQKLPPGDIFLPSNINAGAPNWDQNHCPSFITFSKQLMAFSVKQNHHQSISLLLNFRFQKYLFTSFIYRWTVKELQIWCMQLLDLQLCRAFWARI